MTSEAVMQKLERLEEKIDSIEKTVKGGDQPSRHLTVKKNGGPGCPEVGKIMQAARQGGKFDGVKTQEALGILQQMGVERSDEAVRRMLKRISEEFPNFRCKTENGESHHLQFHPD